MDEITIIGTGLVVLMVSLVLGNLFYMTYLQHVYGDQWQAAPAKPVTPVKLACLVHSDGRVAIITVAYFDGDGDSYACSGHAVTIAWFLQQKPPYHIDAVSDLEIYLSR